MVLVGPGSIVEQDIAPSATLDGMTDDEYATILNPITDDFAVLAAQDKPRDLPISIKNRDGGLTHSERDVTQVYGIGLKNPDFISKERFTNRTIIKSGQSLNFTGSTAQVAVRQLVNEITQREGNTLHQADPNVRKEVESRIIIARGWVQDLMDSKLKSKQEMINEAINKSNEENSDGTFANLNTGTSQTVGSEEGTAGTANIPSGSNDFNTPRPSKTAKK